LSGIRKFLLVSFATFVGGCREIVGFFALDLTLLLVGSGGNAIFVDSEIRNRYFEISDDCREGQVWLVRIVHLDAAIRVLVSRFHRFFIIVSSLIVFGYHVDNSNLFKDCAAICLILAII
jgi:hypothetical protein